MDAIGTLPGVRHPTFGWVATGWVWTGLDSQKRPYWFPCEEQKCYDHIMIIIMISKNLQ